MSELILQTRDLTRRYGHTLALDHAALSVEKGQIFGLVGRNGAGKTTIIRMVTAQTAPTEGELSLFGETGEKALSRARSRTGAMVETPSFYPYLTARQNLEYYRLQRGIPGRRVVDEVLEEVDLASTGKKTFKNFSLGMKQRLGLALALMNHPEFLLLDEPINGLDPEGIVEFRNLLLQLNRERQTTILISSHILSELGNLATCYGFIDNGRMLEQISAKALAENDDGKYDFQFLRIKQELEQLHAQLEGVQAMQKTQAVDEVRMDEIAALLEKFKESGLAFDDLLVRKVVETIRVESAEKLEVTFKDGNRRVVALPERG